jgi:hypothetical protein
MSKNWKPKPEDKDLYDLLTAERNLQAEWYARMSGQKPWADGERQKFADQFCEFSKKIRELQKSEAANFFASLPSE